NVAQMLDAAPDWTFAHTLLMREGFAWVGVSAQVAGIEGDSDPNPMLLHLGLKQVNSSRYSALHHPGDDFSYDMFSQAAQAVRAVPVVLGTSPPARVIATGESQSAFFLTTYVNAIHPLAHVFDGFLIHSRGGIAWPLSATDLVPSKTTIRADIDVPVLTVET